MATLIAILVIFVPAIIIFVRQTGATDKIAPPSYLNNSDSVRTDRLNKWLNEHPEAKKIYNSRELSKFSSEKITNEEIANNLLKMGAKAALVGGSCPSLRSILIITKDMVLAFEGGLGKKEIYTAPNKEKVLERIKIEDVKEYSGYTVPVAQKSVVKSAVVGGIIAGGAGAVVGAIAADNHNRNAPATKTVVETHKTGQKETWYYFMGMETRMPLTSNSYRDICICTASGITIDKDNVKKSISQVLDKIW